MKIGQALLVATCCCLCAQTSAQAPAPTGPALPCQTSWIGNTFGGADNKWVQDFVHTMKVTPDGTVIAACEWDEAGRCVGLYKEGQPNTTLLKQYDGRGGHKAWGWGTASRAVAFDAATLYVLNTEGELLRFRRSDNGFIDSTPLLEIKRVQDKTEGAALNMSCANGLLYILRDTGEILVRKAADLAVVRQFTIPGATDLTVARDGSLWLLADAQIKHVAPTGESLPETISVSGKPTALALDHRGRLIVCDNGPRRQVLFYDISGTPRLVQTFGVRGGIAAGRPGEVLPQKLHSLAGAGTDARGNLYVALSENTVDCTVIRQFRPDGRGGWNRLGWELNGLHFVDAAVPVADSDGTIVYSRSRRFVLDYAQPPGTQWKVVGYTLDPNAGAEEPRRKDSGYHPAFVRRLQGKLLVYMTPMMAGEMYLYTPQPGTEYLRLLSAFGERLGWGIYVDSRGDVWQAGDTGIRHTPFTGFDTTGKPQFGTPQNFPSPAPFDRPQRVMYTAETDTLYVAGYTPEKTEETWGLVGKVLARYDDWSKGNRKPTWVIDLPHDFKPQSGPRIILKSMTIAGDYLFIVGVDTKMQVYVYRIQDGGFVGIMNPGPEIGGNDNTGWVDMPEAISALRRHNGEYVVFVEEDYRNKIVLYRWRPAAERASR